MHDPRPSILSRQSLLRLTIVGLLLLAMVIWWNRADFQFISTSHASTRASTPARREPRRPGTADSALPLPAQTKVQKWTSAEARQYLQAYYRSELLDRELELEQQRYAGKYWQTAPASGGEQDRSLQKTQLTARLQSEANEVFAGMCPGEPAPQLELAPFFNEDRPGPNLSTLTANSREEFKKVLLLLAPDEPLDPILLMDVAESVLSAGELAKYVRWNAPAASALRTRLAGHETNEKEFLALLDWQASLGTDTEGDAKAKLLRNVGPESMVQLEEQMEPTFQTAAQDLRRSGLPLNLAPWLADFRDQAAAKFQLVWADEQLSGAQKEERVRQVQSALRSELRAHLGSAVDMALAGDLLP